MTDPKLKFIRENNVIRDKESRPNYFTTHQHARRKGIKWPPDKNEYADTSVRTDLNDLRA